MRTKIIFLCSIFVLAAPLAAREKTDVLIMRNGDRLTCEIKNLNEDVLSIGLDYTLGTVSIDWSKVDHVESNQLFLVKTQDGAAYSGTLSTPASSGGRPITIQILNPPAEEHEFDKAKVIEITQTSESLWSRFNGNIALGSTFNKGNQVAQYNLNADVNYPQERWSASAGYSSTLSPSSTNSPSTRNEVQFSAQRLMRWKNWYYTGLAQFLQSTEQGIQLQTTFGGGIGRYLKNNNRASVAVIGGFAWQRISYKQDVFSAPTQRVTSALIGTDANFFTFDKTTLDVQASLLPAISEPGRVHFNLNVSYYVKVWRNLSWNITLYDDFDNRPPPGFSGSDYGGSTSLSWKFGNR